MTLEPIQNLNTRDDNLIRLINQLNLWKKAINTYTSGIDTDITTIEADLVTPSLSTMIMATVYRLEGDSNYNMRNTSSFDIVCDDDGVLVEDG